MYFRYEIKQNKKNEKIFELIKQLKFISFYEGKYSENDKKIDLEKSMSELSDSLLEKIKNELEINENSLFEVNDGD